MTVQKAKTVPLNDLVVLEWDRQTCEVSKSRASESPSVAELRHTLYYYMAIFSAGGNRDCLRYFRNAFVSVTKKRYASYIRNVILCSESTFDRCHTINAWLPSCYVVFEKQTILNALLLQSTNIAY